MIDIRLGYEYKEDVRELFRAYTDMLVAHCPEFREYLTMQNYDHEVEHLEEKYGLPDQRLYVVLVDGDVAGCVGLKRINERDCELKRLYVKPEFRRQGLSRLLLEKVIGAASEIGYQSMLLDTLPFLEGALYLYRKMGFYEIPCYNDNPVDGSVYMRLNLGTQGK